MSEAAYDRVRLARDSKRPTGLDYIRHIFRGFLEFHGDRRFADDPAIVGGVAWLGDEPVTVIAIEKGHTAKERTARNFGAPQPEGYRKALRLMKQAEKFGRPVICFVDTSGAFCGIGAEERGQGQAIAENLMEMSTLCVPVLSVLIGEGGSGGALALAVADRVWMLQNAVYSVISPEGCASILWKDADKAAEAAASLRLTAEDAKGLGVVERILSEDQLGEKVYYDRIRQLLEKELQTLMADDDLLQHRYDRFRRLGTGAVTEEFT
ncbi:MAG: acetyl-CoA carboxylase carboxyltransferase subunit alpha [Clostridia bacterium]|nr:acetyl-CoA carboxylase carboxyltransferase subunit alpha [Clostridia bacterium]